MACDEVRFRQLRRLGWLIPFVFTFVGPRLAVAQSILDSLASDFAHPPASARPRAFWHWTGGNITRKGIEADLRWMHSAGIGGVQLGDLSAGCCQTIDYPVPFHSASWYADVQYAAALSRQLGLEMSLFSSAGWSIAGGPWVQPSEAMKKLVWSDTTVEGPALFSAKLPHPPTVNGPFQDIGHARREDPPFYGEVAVLAYRTPADDRVARSRLPEVSTAAGPVDGSALFDKSFMTSLSVRAQANGSAWIRLSFDTLFTARALTLATPKGIPFGSVLASADGKHFQPVVMLPGPGNYRQGSVRTFSFPPVTAKVFKIELTGAPPSPAAVIAEPPPTPDSAYTLTALKLYGGGRVNRWEDKAGFASFLDDYTRAGTPSFPAASEIDTATLVRLTGKMAADGTLRWQVPAGTWTIMRFGYSLTGAKNRPARPGGLGYEVDKLSPRDVRNYLHDYLDSLAAVLGPLYGSTLQYVTLDSWEADMQNWTEDMPAEFFRRRGYDLTPYLPALAGHIVGSAAISDRFLWDFRRTLADMFAENFYGTVSGFLHPQGIRTYGEASGVSLVIPEDALLTKKQVDIPMGEFWVHPLHPESMYYVDVRGAASAAHTYGKPYVAAESFTGGGYQDPYTLKKVADYWFAQGVNRIVLHNAALQPLDTKPGNMMVGTRFDRNITWAGLARPFMDYLSRTSALLQQGRFVADIAYLLQEGAPSTMPFWGDGLRPALPDGYDYDFVNTDLLLREMSVDTAGDLVLQSGMHYRVLVLPPHRWMTLPVLRKIDTLVREGATVVGPPPLSSPSLAGFPASDSEITLLARSVWGDLDGITRTVHYYGKGRVVWGQSLDRVMTALALPKDVSLDRPLDSHFAWIHRRKAHTDLYFIASLGDSAAHIRARFRVHGKKVSLWRPGDGTVETARYEADDSLTTVRLDFPPHGALFVVFSDELPGAARPALRKLYPIDTLEGPWTLHFPPGLGAPGSTPMPRLVSWTREKDPGIRFFSGTATYTASLDWHPGKKDTGRLFLDLGAVHDLAEIRLNGKALGIFWKPPFRTEITGLLRPGENTLTVQVTNEWINRLIGDENLPPGKKILSGGLPRFGKPPVLRESGLLGPVRILRPPSATPKQTP